MSNGRLITLIVAILIVLGIVFGDHQRLRHLLSSIAELVYQPSMCADQTDESFHPHKVNNSH